MFIRHSLTTAVFIGCFAMAAQAQIGTAPTTTPRKPLLAPIQIKPATPTATTAPQQNATAQKASAQMKLSDAELEKLYPGQKAADIRKRLIMESAMEMPAMPQMMPLQNSLTDKIPDRGTQGVQTFFKNQ